MQGKLAIRFAVAAFAVGALGFAAQPAAAQTWKPTKPITIIVPWAAGGSTDPGDPCHGC